MIAVVWHFDVKPGLEDAFEQFLGVEGDWATISRRSRSFLGCSFLRDQSQNGRYLLVEYWSEMVVYEKHKDDFGDELVQLERQRDELVSQAQAVGVFSAIDVPDRTGPTWSRRGG